MESAEGFDESRRSLELNIHVANLVVGVLEDTLDSEKALTPRAEQCISQLRSMVKTLHNNVLDICGNVEPASEWKARDKIYWKEEGDPRDLAKLRFGHWRLALDLREHVENISAQMKLLIEKRVPIDP